jgi:hypothetical protein
MKFFTDPAALVLILCMGEETNPSMFASTEPPAVAV